MHRILKTWIYAHVCDPQSILLITISFVLLLKYFIIFMYGPANSTDEKHKHNLREVVTILITNANSAIMQHDDTMVA